MVLTMQKSMSADHQQGTIAQIAWLAGIVDGEGSIGIYERKYKGTPYTNYSLRITITNTSVIMLDAIKELLNKLGLAFYVVENQRQNNPNWRPRWQMLFTGYSRGLMFLKLIRPHLVAKAHEADLALEFLESRSNCPMQGTPYSIRDLEIVKELREAKRNGHLRDHV